MSASPERLELFRRIDDRLSEQPGGHRRSDWWDGLASRGYTHATAQREIAQVGRGGNKSTMGRRFAETEMLSQWVIPPNERHYFAWVSENTEEAAQRPRQIEADLLALGIPCTRSGNTVDIDGLPIGFKAFACRVGAVSGFRCIGFVCDEEAKWRSADDGANPAREVVASLRAMCVTHPEAREWHLSSPLSTLDYHYEQFAAGENDVQIVANAPSWIANPGAITEEQTHRLERDARVWAREYAAIPQDGAIDDFFGEGLTVALTDDPPPPPARPLFAIDPAFAHDRFGWAVISTQPEPNPPPNTTPRRVTYVHESGAWRAAGAKPSDLLERFRREVIAKYPATPHRPHVFTDQYEGFSLSEVARTVGLTLQVVPWTSGSSETSKGARYRAVRTAMYERAFRVRRGDVDLIREMRSVRSVISASGNERIESPRNATGHGDAVSAVVLAGSIALSRTPTAPPEEPKPWTAEEEVKAHKSRLLAAQKARRQQDPWRDWRRQFAH